jgi:hypothetical protein
VKLIDDWKQALRGLSVKAHTAQVAIVGTWLALPEDMRSAVPVKFVLVTVAVVGAAGVLGRLINEDKSNADPH